MNSEEGANTEVEEMVVNSEEEANSEVEEKCVAEVKLVPEDKDQREEVKTLSQLRLLQLRPRLLQLRPRPKPKSETKSQRLIAYE